LALRILKSIINKVSYPRSRFVDLEIAYIESRYLPAQFLKEQIDLMFKFVEDLLSIFKNG
jgi:hypothetical protein